MEAICSTLALIGCQKQADEVISKFGWSESFWSVNEELFGLYKDCKNSDDLIKREGDYQKLLVKEEEERIKRRDAMMHVSSSSSDEVEEKK